MYKSELAKLAGVSPRTFRRYLATRRPILTAMGVSPFARKLPPPAVHYISEDYCIDIPDNTATLSNKTTTDLSDLTDYPPRQPIKTIHRVSCESLSKGRRKQGCKREYRVSRDTKKARESSAVRDSRLHPSLGGRPWMGECFFATFFAPKKRRRKY